MTATIAGHMRRHAVAYLALFVALGGTSYAAVSLPRDSVGAKQLKSSSVTSSKVKDGSLRAKDLAGSDWAGLKGDPGPRGLEGPAGRQGADGQAGSPGPKGDTGATGQAGSPGPKGDTGATGGPGADGANGGFVALLPSGQTMRGRWLINGYGTSNPSSGSTAISFPFALAAAPASTQTFKEADSPTAQCPGSAAQPEATAGYLCIHRSGSANLAGAGAGNLLVLNTYRYGANIADAGSGGGPFTSQGSWAFTAP